MLYADNWFGIEDAIITEWEILKFNNLIWVKDLDGWTKWISFKRAREGNAHFRIIGVAESNQVTNKGIEQELRVEEGH